MCIWSRAAGMRSGFTRQRAGEGEKDFMTANLRPMSLSEILDRTFQIYRARLWLFVCISSVPVFAWELIFFINTNWLQTHALDHSSGNTGILLWNFVASHVNYYAFFLVALLAMPAAVKVTECSFLEAKCTALSFSPIRCGILPTMSLDCISCCVGISGARFSIPLSGGVDFC